MNANFTNENLDSPLNSITWAIYVDTQKIINKLLELNSALKAKDTRIDELESEVQYLHHLMEKAGCDMTIPKQVWNRPISENPSHVLVASN